MQSKLKFVAFSVLITVGLFSFQYQAKATTCNSGNLFLARNSDVVWGNPTPGSQPADVSASPNSTVRLSVGGEDGCAGQTVTFQVTNGGSIVATFSGKLVLGPQVTSTSPAVYQLYYDWTNTLSNGTYLFRTILPTQSGNSWNGLIVSAAQACNISKVYSGPNANGGAPGDTVQLSVETTGSCQGGMATIDVRDATNPSNPTVFNGSAQDVSSGKAVWSWTLPLLGNTQQQNGYFIMAHLGNQNIQSATFFDTRCTGSVGGPCNPSPQSYSCSSNNQCMQVSSCTGANCYTTSNCDFKCTAATQDQSYTFNITNPLKGGPNDLFDIINIVTQWILYISIPLAVLWIMYAGFLMLTAGPKPENFKKGRDILTYTVIGLAIIFIGKGFVSLIISVIQLGGTSPTTTQGPIGSACTQNTNCQTGLICNNICQRSSGNVAGEPCMSVLNCSLGFTCNKVGSTGAQDIGKCVQQ